MRGAPTQANRGRGDSLKQTIKRALGQGLISLGEQLPQARRLLKPLAVRTSRGRFGNRAVSIPLGEDRVMRFTQVDENYLAFQLFWKGGDYYEPITRRLLQALVRPGDTFIDMGAHVGFFSIVIGLSVPRVKVVAFEPNPSNFRMLEANVAANALGIVCEPFAISDKGGTAILYLTESDMSASLMKDFQAEDTQQIGSLNVPTTSLDGYIQGHPIDGGLVIKVDIEGHEPAFFRGAAETLARRKPDLVLEVLYDQEPALVSWLKSLGYRFYPITDEGCIELEAPRLVKRFPFLFLNHLVSARPKREIAALFERLGPTVGRLNLRETSKHFPKEEWPLLWG